MNLRYVASHVLAYMIVMHGILGVAALAQKSGLAAYWLSTLFVMYQLYRGDRRKLTFLNGFAVAASGLVVSLISTLYSHQFPTLFPSPFTGIKGVAVGWAAGLLIFALMRLENKRKGSEAVD